MALQKGLYWEDCIEFPFLLFSIFLNLTCVRVFRKFKIFLKVEKLKKLKKQSKKKVLFWEERRKDEISHPQKRWICFCSTFRSSGLFLDGRFNFKVTNSFDWNRFDDWLLCNCAAYSLCERALLEEGFIWKGHQQRLRRQNVPFISFILPPLFFLSFHHFIALYLSFLSFTKFAVFQNKRPEALGIVSSTVLLLCVIVFQPFFPHVEEYQAATTSICFTILIGFMDDVFDLKWSVKIGLSFLGAVPLLVAYAGSTKVVIPKPLREYLGMDVELGVFYLLYMVLLAVFCTNSINIHAGINGLEVGQSLVIGFSSLLHNLVEIYSLSHSLSLIDSSKVELLQQTRQALWGHFFSFSLLMPFLSTSTALFYFNSFPSQVFVGDTFTYFSGMILAVCGILGKYSKTLMLFFVPQFLNFLLSVPQLFNLKLGPLIYPCPRHRLPKFVKQTGKLHFTNNGTLINLFLFLFGDTSESTLCVYLLLFQLFFTLVAFFIRYTVASWFYWPLTDKF